MPLYNDFFHQFLQVSRTFTKKLNEQLSTNKYVSMHSGRLFIIYTYLIRQLL